MCREDSKLRTVHIQSLKVE